VCAPCVPHAFRQDFDLYSFACTVIDSLYIPRRSIFKGWRRSRECLSPLPGVKGSPQAPGHQLGGLPVDFTLPAHRLEYVLYRLVQQPMQERVTNIDAVYALVDAVTDMDMTAVMPQY
jgi:hypothetical protein